MNCRFLAKQKAANPIKDREQTAAFALNCSRLGQQYYSQTQETKASTFALKFHLGQIVATPGAICTEDKAPNDQALV
jgi:hypothetical protein